MHDPDTNPLTFIILLNKTRIDYAPFNGSHAAWSLQNGGPNKWP
jgi:hypothetical protein